MKTSPVTVALVAAASSIVTVGTIELLRGSRPGSRPGSRTALAVDPSPPPSAASTAHAADPLVQGTRVPDRPTDYGDRLAELERRIAALELGSTSRRTPVTSTAGELPAQDELRDLVLDWVAEEREARQRAEELEHEGERQKEEEFDARYQAHVFAREHGLAKWQEDEFARLFLETAERARAIEVAVDPRKDDPKEVEARWVEFDEWVDQRERELTALMGPELYEEIYGDD